MAAAGWQAARRLFLYALLRDESEVIAEHEQNEQRDGKSDTHRQCFHRAVGTSLVTYEVQEGRCKAPDYYHQEEDDDDFHKCLPDAKFSG